MQSRRAALVTLAAGTFSPLLAQHAGHDVQDVTTTAQPHDPIFFSKPDYAIVSHLVDLIIPRTDTPGALDANVPYRIDHEVSGNRELQAIFEAGLSSLAAKAPDFLTLSMPQQVSILTAMSESPNSNDGRFFQAIKDLTIDWYYRSEEGLVSELGFHGNTFRANFPGCTHPEHWPIASATQEQK